MIDRTNSRYRAEGPPNERGFIHKRIFGAAKGALGGILSGGGPLGILGGAARGFAGGGTRTPDRVPISRVDARSFGVIPVTSGCPPGFSFVNGQCQENQRAIIKTPGFRGGLERFLPGGRTGFEVEPRTVAPTQAAAVQGGFGDAVMGRFGAALEPAVRMTDTRVCPRGTVLGMDGLCYNRRDIRNNERAWPRGRRPLLTGGEMRCITVAASAAKKLKTKQKQLETLGLLKRPAPRRRLPAGHTARLEHGSDH